MQSTQVNKRKGEEYRLFWSEQPDFVRMAAKLNALIIPFAAVGGDEAFDIAMDSDDILRAPILGDLVRAAAQRYAPVSAAQPPSGHNVPIFWECMGATSATDA